MKFNLILPIIYLCCSTAQEITTIQIDGIQYYISRMNPYSSEMNYYLAYKYCRSFGLQLISLDTKEKVDSITEYIKNAGYAKYSFWTSGNNLGTNIFLWMSTGQPFNSTFNYINKTEERKIGDIAHNITSRISSRSINSGSINNCIAISSPNLVWSAEDCMLVKDFICEQTQCNYNNYDNISTSAKLGSQNPYTKHASLSSTISSAVELNGKVLNYKSTDLPNTEEIIDNDASNNNTSSVVTTTTITEKFVPFQDMKIFNIPLLKLLLKPQAKNHNGPQNFLNYPKLFNNNLAIKNNISTDLKTHNIDSMPHTINLWKENGNNNFSPLKKEKNSRTAVEILTVGPYDSVIQDYQADEGEFTLSQLLILDNSTDDDTSTVLPEAESSYKYNIKVRNDGKVLDPLSQ